MSVFRNKNIKFVSYLGTTGYSKSAQDWIYALVSHGANITFESLHTDPGQDTSPKYQLARSLLNRKLRYDIVFIYAIPHNMMGTCKRERNKNRHVKIYGFSLWEADRLPKSWIEPLNKLDHLIVHSEWNKHIFSRDVDIPVHVVYQPFEYVSKYTKSQLLTDNLFKNIQSDDYVFYTIGEWNGRKNIEALIRGYLAMFKKTDKTVLYVKTVLHNYQETSKKMLRSYVENIMKEFPDSARIILNVDRLTDDEINKVHSMSDCFVSTCRAEGIGLGACIAGLLGKRVIITGFGAQTEYLKDADFINYKLVPADNCHWGPVDHSKCNKNTCNFNSVYDKSYQKWADPDIEHFCKLLKKVYEEKQNKKTTAEYIKKVFHVDNVMQELRSIVHSG